MIIQWIMLPERNDTHTHVFSMNVQESGPDYFLWALTESVSVNYTAWITPIVSETLSEKRPWYQKISAINHKVVRFNFNIPIYILLSFRQFWAGHIKTVHFPMRFLWREHQLFKCVQNLNKIKVMLVGEE